VHRAIAATGKYGIDARRHDLASLLTCSAGTTRGHRFGLHSGSAQLGHYSVDLCGASSTVATGSGIV
jgi:hypothetical protein